MKKIKLVSFALCCMLVGYLVALVVNKDVIGVLKNNIQHRKYMQQNVWPYAESIRIKEAMSNEATKKVVMLGDSITEWGDWGGGIHDFKIENHGVGGDKTIDILDRLSSFKNGEVDRVFIMAGINDIFASVDEDEIIKNYSEIIDNLMSKNMDVSVFSVLPISKRNSRYKEVNLKVKSLNDKINNLAAQKNINYINISEDFSNANDFSLIDEYTVDSVHLSKLAYAKWIIKMSAILK